MLNKLKKLIENKANGERPCEKILGSIEDVYKLAAFWEDNADLFHLIGMNETLEYIASREFTSAESASFKEGVGTIPAFLQKCWEEREQVERELLKRANTD